MQAEDGIGLPEEILEGSSFGEAANLYFMFTRFDFLWSLNYLALVLLNFFEVCTIPCCLIQFQSFVFFLHVKLIPYVLLVR